mmetsp:Transcript_35145/g.73201  ORF Transcript_35145/g.73201 Transcript_35145/m.73201 type:complete len:93 (+) Transcript_35145:748-1026(+)
MFLGEGGFSCQEQSNSVVKGCECVFWLDWFRPSDRAARERDFCERMLVDRMRVEKEKKTAYFPMQSSNVDKFTVSVRSLSSTALWDTHVILC